jgi:REP element-mobilizing transposase RayT
MPRALRLEAENASYHVINRGNYRAPIFASLGAKRAFLRCLDEACLKTGWLIHAWCLMSNHFHLAVTTPLAGLAAGMHWLECTFATRFNRFRNERGHLFQGRYQSIAVEDGDALGSVSHYIHLNPVRAGLCSTSELPQYPWTSLRGLVRPTLRPGWYDPLPFLDHAGGLADTPDGHRRYTEYLQWLAENDAEQKRQYFGRMCQGWAIGTVDFARSLLTEAREFQGSAKRLAADMHFEYEAHWETELDALLRRIGRTRAELRAAGKSAEWKIALAAALKARTTATNPWLSRQLHAGSRREVGRKVAAWLRAPNPKLLRKLGLKHTPHNPTP